MGLPTVIWWFMQGPWLFRVSKGNQQELQDKFLELTQSDFCHLLLVKANHLFCKIIREVSIQGCEEIDFVSWWEEVSHYRDVDTGSVSSFLFFNITHFYYEPNSWVNFHYTLAASFTPQEFNRRYSEKNSAWVSMTFFSPKIYSQFGKNMSKINICYKSNMSFIIAKKETPEKIILFTHW